MSITIFDVAEWYLSKSEMTHKKLQKLCYYAYSWFIYLNNDEIEKIENKLFEEKFEAWVHGPVNKELYTKYSNYKWYNIPKKLEMNKKLSNYEEFLENIWNVYGEYTGDQLETMTHNEIPWKRARNNLKTFESSNELINEKDMFMEYSMR